MTLCYICVTKSRADSYNVTESIISDVCEQSETSVRLSVCERPSSVTGTRPHSHALTRRAARPPASLSASLPFSSLSFSSIFPFKLSAYSRLAARGPLYADRSARRRTDHRISNFSATGCPGAAVIHRPSSQRRASTFPSLGSPDGDVSPEKS